MQQLMSQIRPIATSFTLTPQPQSLRLGGQGAQSAKHGLHREWDGRTKSGAQTPAAPATVCGEWAAILPLPFWVGRRQFISTRKPGDRPCKVQHLSVGQRGETI